ncbi:MAG: hypothetical protein J1F25_06495 [Prevotellaceae bacterium]|nr:hypothetical protein [Prevotellaceae bacterium]
MGMIVKTNLRKFPFQEKPLYVTSAVHYNRITSEALLEAAARNSGINEATIYAGMKAVLNEFENFLLNGHSVQVPLLGSYRVSFRAKGVDSKEEAGANTIYRRRIIFSPSSRLQSKLKAMTIGSLAADILTTADDDKPSGGTEQPKTPVEDENNG